MLFRVVTDPDTGAENLCVFDVRTEEDRRRLANVELAMLHEFGYISASPFLNEVVTLTFHPNVSKEKIRKVLSGFCIEI